MQNEVWDKEDNKYPNDGANPPEKPQTSRGAKRELDGAQIGPQSSAKRDDFRDQFAQRRKRTRLATKEQRQRDQNHEVATAKQILSTNSRMMKRAMRRLSNPQSPELARNSGIIDRRLDGSLTDNHKEKDPDDRPQSQATGVRIKFLADPAKRV